MVRSASYFEGADGEAWSQGEAPRPEAFGIRK